MKTGTALIQAGFGIAVRYVIAQAIAQITTAITSWGIVGFSVRQLYNIFKELDDKKRDIESDVVNFKLIVYTILVILFAVIAIGNPIFTGISKLFAPEWYAILNVIDLVK